MWWLLAVFLYPVAQLNSSGAAEVTSIGDVFGWVQSLLEKLAVWTTFSAALGAIIMVSATVWLLRVLRS